MITGLNHITFSVVDLGRAFTFYKEVLGLRPMARWYKGAYFTAGDMWFCLNLEDHLQTERDNSTYDHIAFSVADADFDDICSRLESAGAIRWQENHSEGKSFYFLDPDGHKLEIHTTHLPERLTALRMQPPRELELFNQEGV